MSEEVAKGYSHFQDGFWGGDGYDALRQYMRTSQDFCREVAAIFSDRADAEFNYYKALTKIAGRATKVTRNAQGTVQAAWEKITVAMAKEAETHKSFAESLIDELSKPLRAFAEQLAKDARPVDQAVEKAVRAKTDQLTVNNKAKRNAYLRARDVETANEILEDAHIGPKQPTEKEVSKLKAKIKKAEKVSKTADADYLETCRKAEDARHQWESTMYISFDNLEEIERKRMDFFKKIFSNYHSRLAGFIPDLQESCDGINERTVEINADADISTTTEARGKGPNVAEQLLYDCFDEDLTCTINVSRRTTLLKEHTVKFQKEVDKAQKIRKGLASLSRFCEENPNFNTESGQGDVQRQLAAADAAIDFFQACLYKIRVATSQLDGRPKPQHRLAEFVHATRDRLGMQVTFLKVPIQHGGNRSVVFEDPFADDDPFTKESPPEKDEPSTASTPNDDDTSQPAGTVASQQTASERQPDNTFSETSSSFSTNTAAVPDSQAVEQQPMGNASTAADQQPEQASTSGTCRALYDYTAQQDGELTIKAGDVISNLHKTDDTWWYGDIAGAAGYFPATYVEEL